MPSDRRFWIATLGAAALHGVMVVAVLAQRSSTLGAMPVSVVSAATLEEVDILRDTPAVAPSFQERTSQKSNALPDHARPAVSSHQQHLPETPHVLTAEPEREPGAALERPTWSFHMADQEHADAGAPLALGAAIEPGVWRAIAAHNPSENDALASVRAAVRQGDRGIGISAGAPLLPLTREVVRVSHAPTAGHARFEFRTDANGIVASVRVLDASSDRRAWDDVAETLQKEAHSRTLLVPTGAHGLAVTIDVSSAVRTASGVDPGEKSVSMASPVGTGMVKSSAAAQPLRFDVVLGPTQVDATMRFGLGDALHDATAADRRVVFAQIVEERVL